MMTTKKNNFSLSYATDMASTFSMYHLDCTTHSTKLVAHVVSDPCLKLFRDLTLSLPPGVLAVGLDSLPSGTLAVGCDGGGRRPSPHAGVD